ncbi:ankyrin repeat-containing domain protein [Pyronema omphalodes]|nr:ankyrin repeat-containing domain protein [Pyronema omphalodes]
MNASMTGCRKLVEALLHEEVNKEALNDNQQTALHLAVLNGREDVVKYLLDEKAEIDIQNDDGITALGMAARYGYEDKTRLLLEKEADPNLRNKFGETVLEIACTGNGFVGAQLLIEAGAVVEPDKEYAGILLAEAEYQDDKKLVELIARACPDQLLYDSALHAATRSGYHIETIRRLLDAGGSPHWKDEYGWSAFDLAVSFRRDDLVSLLQTVSPPAASNLDATISTTRQESKMQWRKRQIWQSNNLNITDLEVEYVGKVEKELLIFAQRLNDADNGYIDELVQGSRPFSLSHTLDSSDSLLLGDDDPPTASSPRDNKPEIYFEITILMKQSHW